MGKNTDKIKRSIRGVALGLMFGGVAVTSNVNANPTYPLPNLSNTSEYNSEDNVQKDERGNIIGVNEKGYANLKKYFKQGMPEIRDLDNITMDSKITKIILAYEWTTPEFGPNGEYPFSKIKDPNICGGVKVKYSLTALEWCYNNGYLDSSISFEEIKNKYYQRNITRFGKT